MNPQNPQNPQSPPKAPNPQITGFKIEGRRLVKIVVLVDGAPWATLDPETVVREHLATGQALTERRRREVLFADEVVRARKAAAGHAAHSPKTRLELDHFLMERGFGPLSRRKALEVLGEAGIVDDEAAAGRVVASRRRKGGVGPRRLEAELRHRGIAPGVAGRKVTEALAGADLAAECLALARKILSRYQPIGERTQRAKMAAFLMRRGYESAHVWAAIRKVAEENGSGGAGEDEAMEPPLEMDEQE